MNSEEIKTKARLIMAGALKVNPDTITDQTSKLDLTEWDSVRHMNVVLALENEFGFEFDDAELPQLNTLPQIVAAVEKHLHG